MTNKPTSTDSFSWNYAIPILSWYIIKGMLIGFGIFLLVFGLVALSAWIDAGPLTTFTPDIYFALGFVVLIFVITYIVLLIGFPHGFESRCTISAKGITQESGTRVKRVNRSVAVIGVLAGSTGTAGAGLTAAAGDYRSLSWSEIKVIKINQKTHYVFVSKGFPSLYPIGNFYHPKDFETIKQLVEKYAKTPVKIVI